MERELVPLEGGRFGHETPENYFPLHGVCLSYFSAFIDQYGGRHGPLSTMTTGGVCEHIIKPDFLASRLPYYKRLPEHFIKDKADCFVSHAWTNRFLDVVDAMASWCEENSRDPHTTFVWFDLFTYPQHGTVAHSRSWWASTFPSAIRSIGHVVLVMTPWDNPISFTRAWCVYEMFSCMSAGCSLSLALPPDENRRLLDALRSEEQPLYDIFENIRSERSIASSVYDQERIHEAISALKGGHGMVNRTVVEGFQRCLEGFMKRRIEANKARRDEGEELRWTYSLGNHYLKQDRYDLAEALLVQCRDRRTRALGVDHPGTLSATHKLAKVYYLQGRYKLAQSTFVVCLSMRKQILGENHPDTLTTLENLANAYWAQDRFKHAEPLYVDCLARRRQVLGEEHMDTLTAICNLADLYYSKSQYKHAEPLHVDCLSRRKRTLGEDHTDTLRSANGLALVYIEQQRYAIAETVLVDALSRNRRIRGDRHSLTVSMVGNLALLYHRQNRLDLAEPLYQENVENLRRALGDEHPETVMSVNNLAVLYRDQGRYDLAERMFADCFRRMTGIFGELHDTTMTIEENLKGIRKSIKKAKKGNRGWLF
ncbi:hypothetical protein BJ742DRAFT_837030 [Cladochytrium replicatum]|nr:hypothetical protein BJ742DRAFT_837030 [Cladochytrium replicatum]